MIDHLAGKILTVSEEAVVVAVGGVGFKVLLPKKDLADLPQEGSDVSLYTYLNVREDALILFGFLNRQDQLLFTLLISVSGVGPKTALTMLSALEAPKLIAAIAQENLSLITSIQGIGPKTARLICVQLKEKIAKVYPQESAGVLPRSVDNPIVNDVIGALVALGYNNREAKDALKKIDPEFWKKEKVTVEEALKQCLKYLF